jgi:hypothetical protein
MLRAAIGRWARYMGVAAIGAASLAALALPTAPAQARVFVGIGVPGYYAPYYGYGYGYPYYGYGYGYPGVFFGFGGHRHWHHRW